MHSDQRARNAVVITVEGLGTSLIGAYGSNLARTPALDRLASNGVLLDQLFVDSTELRTQLRSCWTGDHALQISNAAASQSATTDRRSVEGENLADGTNSVAGWNAWEHCQELGLPACLMTDSHEAAELAEQMGCQDVVFVPPEMETPSAAGDSLDETESALAADSSKCSVMQLFIHAAEELQDRNGLVWVHSRGMRLPWDAPVELRVRFVDPDDPDPPLESGPPSLVVDSETDPDEVVGWGQVATAQASVVDEGIAALQTAVITRVDADNWSFAVASFGGVPLGEHGRVGWGPPQLHGEELACMAIVVPSQEIATAENKGVRRAELFQLPDLAITVMSLLGLGENTPPRWGIDVLSLDFSDSPSRWQRRLQLAAVADRTHHWLRCPAWSAVIPDESLRDLEGSLDTLDSSAALYVKPEDRWEVNNVADRRSDVLETMTALARQFQIALKEHDRGNWDALPSVLIELLR